jgi:hypothetical protein
VEEVVMLAVAVFGTVGVGLVLSEVMQNCGCSKCPHLPDRVEGGVALTKTFKISKAEDIEALTPLSAELQGKLIKNSSVPYKFSFVVGKGFSETRRSPVYHAGLLIVGKFEETGQEFHYMFADRWLDCVRVTLFKEKSAALARIRDIVVNDVPLTDCDETPAFTSFTPAGNLVQYVQEDLAKKPSVTGFKSETDLANPTITASPSPSVEVCFWQATARQRTS